MCDGREGGRGRGKGGKEREREKEKLNECGKMSVGEGNIQHQERDGYLAMEMQMDKNNYLFVYQQKRTLKLQISS